MFPNEILSLVKDILKKSNIEKTVVIDYSKTSDHLMHYDSKNDQINIFPTKIHELVDHIGISIEAMVEISTCHEIGHVIDICSNGHTYELQLQAYKEKIEEAHRNEQYEWESLKNIQELNDHCERIAWGIGKEYVSPDRVDDYELVRRVITSI